MIAKEETGTNLLHINARGSILDRVCHAYSPLEIILIDVAIKSQCVIYGPYGYCAFFCNDTVNLTHVWTKSVILGDSLWGQNNSSFVGMQ